MAKPKFEIGNQVYVKLAGNAGHGEVLYEITDLMVKGTGCKIREYRSAPPFYAEQWFDTSLLVHAVTDEMLAAFRGVRRNNVVKTYIAAIGKRDAEEGIE